MEAAKDEAFKRYYNNHLSFWNIIRRVEVVAVVALFGYWCFPAIVNLLQVVNVWLDWLRFVLSNIFFFFFLLNVLIGLIYVLCHKTTENNKPDLYDQYSAAVRPSPVDYYIVTEVRGFDDRCPNKEIVPSFQEVKESNRYDCRVVMEKSYRRTRSEKKARSTVEYRRTESERVKETKSWRSQTMEGLSSEEFRMTVETFITQKKKMLLQQNGVVSPDDNGTSRHRSRRLVDSSVTSVSTGFGSYLAISN